MATKAVTVEVEGDKQQNQSAQDGPKHFHPPGCGGGRSLVGRPACVLGHVALGVWIGGQISHARVLFFEDVVKANDVYDNGHAVREFLSNNPLEMSGTERVPRFARE